MECPNHPHPGGINFKALHVVSVHLDDINTTREEANEIYVSQFLWLSTCPLQQMRKICSSSAIQPPRPLMLPTISFALSSLSAITFPCIIVTWPASPQPIFSRIMILSPWTQKGGQNLPRTRFPLWKSTLDIHTGWFVEVAKSGLTSSWQQRCLICEALPGHFLISFTLYVYKQQKWENGGYAYLVDPTRALCWLPENMNRLSRCKKRSITLLPELALLDLSLLQKNLHPYQLLYLEPVAPKGSQDTLKF